jgi:hypothetical protein
MDLVPKGNCKMPASSDSPSPNNINCGNQLPNTLELGSNNVLHPSIQFHNEQVSIVLGDGNIIEERVQFICTKELISIMDCLEIQELN